MKVQKFFRLELDVEAVIEAAEVKKVDIGINRYFKHFLNQLVKDPEALRDFFFINFMDRYVKFDNDETTFAGLLDIGGSDSTYILSAAEKCDPDVYCYFNDLFRPDLRKDCSEEPQSDENKIQFNQDESALILGLLSDHLSKLIPIKIQWYELPVESIKQEKMNKKEMLK